MKKILALLLALMLLPCVAAAEEELPRCEFRFVHNMSFAVGLTVEEMHSVSEFEVYKQETKSGDGWASWTAVGVPVGDYENVSVSFRGAGDSKWHIIGQCEYCFADSKNGDYDNALNTLISVYGEPVHTQASGTQFDTVENCHGAFISGIANAKHDETIKCNRYAQWMFIDKGTIKPVLIDISEMTGTDGAVMDVIVRYSVIPEETTDEETTSSNSTNGF